MKKFLALFLAFCMIATSTVFVPLTVAAEDATITVTDAASLEQAFKDIPNGGTIVVNGDIVIDQTSNGHISLGSGSGKTYTVTGGSLDFSALSSSDGSKAFIDIKDNITFTKTKFITDSSVNDYMFANGYNLTIAEDVTFEGNGICAYGGVLNGNCSSVNLTLLSGKYTTINGTSNSKRNITGDVNIHIGGTAKFNTLLGNSGGCTIDGNVTILVDGSASGSNVYGGGNGGTIEKNTDVTIAGEADVKLVLGGGTSGTIKGNTKVTVKDHANTKGDCDPSSHSMTYAIFGGSSVTKNSEGDITSYGTIEGYTEVYFSDYAQANYIWGGCYLGGTVKKGTNITMSGSAKTMSMFGGGFNATQNCNATVTLLGGELEQIFGACQNASLVGNVTVRLLGGKVTRRVYGGCYNDFNENLEDLFGGNFGWQSHHNVDGIIYLVIGEGVKFNLSGSDKACSAHSRRDTVNTDQETGVVIYTNDTVKSNTTLSSAFSGGATHETTHVYKYTLNNGNEIIQTCSEHSSRATATITPASSTYTGEAIGVTVVYSEDGENCNKWEFEEFNVSYANNVNAGTATATLTIEGLTTINHDYNIAKISVDAPVVTVSGNKVIGLTTDMEYSTNGVDYTKVSDANMDFAAGRYFIRYAESTNTYASSSVKVLVISGNYVFANSVYAVKGNEVEITVSAPESLGKITATVTYGGSSQNVTFTGSGKVTFTASDSAEVTVTCNKENVTLVNGYITVVEKLAGDLSGNKIIDLSDIIAMRKLIASEETNELADVNGDGEITSSDVVILRQYLASYSFEVGESTVTLYN